MLFLLIWFHCIYIYSPVPRRSKQYLLQIREVLFENLVCLSEMHIFDECVNVYIDYVYEVEICATDYRNRSMHFGFISKHQCVLKLWTALLKLICFITLFSPLWLFFRCACTTDVSVADTSMKLCSPLWLFFRSIFTLETCVRFFSEVQRYSFRN